MNRNTKVLENKSIGKLLLSLSIPAAIGMIVQSLYNIVDAIFVGRGVGAMGIAGITISFPIQIIIMALAQLIGIGSASIISRALGASNFEKAEHALGNAFSLSFIIGFIVTIFGTIFIDKLLLVFGATKTILPYAKSYMSIILFGAIFSIFGMALNSVVRAEGNARIAMLTMIIGAISNIILDPIFIFAFNMGIRGAAIATVIAQSFTFIWLLIYYLRGKSVMKLKLKNFIFDRSITLETFAIGVSSFVRQASASLMIAILNHSLAFYGGDIAITIYGILNRLSSFAILPAFGVAQGFQPIAGYNYGAKRYDRTKRSIFFASFFASGVTTFGFLIMFMFPKQLIGLFTRDMILINMSILPLRYIVLAFPLVGFIAIAATLFQAIGKAFESFILSMARQIIFLIPLVLLMPRFIGLPGIWYSFPIADFLTGVLSFAYIIPEIKKLDAKITGMNLKEEVIPGFQNTRD